MSNKCVNEATGELREELNKAVKDRMKDLGVSPSDVEFRLALKDVTEKSKLERGLRKRKELHDNRAIFKQVHRLREAAKETDPKKRRAALEDASRSIFFNKRGLFYGEDFETLVHQFKNRLESKNLGAMAALRSRIFRAGAGMDRSHNNEILRHMLGIKRADDPEIAAMADGLTSVLDDSVELMRENGIPVAKINGKYVPQRLDKRSLKNTTKDAFARELMGNTSDGKPIIDRSKMIDHTTGDQYTEDELFEIVKISYDTVRTDGLSKTSDLTEVGGSATIYSRRQAHRVLYYTPEGYMEVMAKYGDDDILSTVDSYVVSAIKDAALSRLLGSNPARGMDMVIRYAKYQLRDNTDWANNLERKLRVDYNQASGYYDFTINDRLDRAGAYMRGITTAGSLGQAIFVAFGGDPSTMVLTTLNREGNIFRAADLFFKQLRSSKEAIEEARQSGYAIDVFQGRSTLDRISGRETVGGFLSGTLPTGVLEKTGMVRWTEAMRRTAVQAAQTDIGARLHQTWDKLPRAFSGMLEGNGITREDWDILRASDTLDLKGTLGAYKAIDQLKFREANPDLEFKLDAMIHRELQRAIVVMHHRSETWFRRALSDHQAGDPRALMADLFKQFKRFPAGITSIMMDTFTNPYLTAAQKTRNFAIAAIPGTIGGAFALQLNEILAGRDPEDMTTAGFIGKAFSRGTGFLGIGEIAMQMVGFDIGRVDNFGQYAPDFAVFSAMTQVVPFVGYATRPIMEFAQSPGAGAALTFERIAALAGGDTWMINPLVKAGAANIHEYLDENHYRKRQRRIRKRLRREGRGVFREPTDVLPRRLPRMGSE